MACKMIHNEKIRLLEAWKDNIFAEYSISEIMRLAKKKTKPWVFNSLKLLIKKKLLVSKTKGNINIYRLSMSNPLVFQTLQYLEAQHNYSFPKLEIIQEAINKIPVKNYSLIVFGSYAKNRQTKESDLDICFLVENKEMEKRIKPYFNAVKLDCPINIDEHYITFDDFIKMLLLDEENLGKQIFRRHKLFFNADIYYKLIIEAHKNGFRQ